MSFTENNILSLSQKSDDKIQWGHPRPLLPSLDPETHYPAEALPSILGKAVTAYQCYGQQPIALVACSALANLSLACQALANVARDRYLISPASLYFLVVAQSGVLFFATIFRNNCPKHIF